MLRTLRGHTLNVLCVAWQPGGPLLASGSADGSTLLWDTRSGSPSPAASLPHASAQSHPQSQNEAMVNDLVFSSTDSQLLASCCGRCVAWHDVRMGHRLATLADGQALVRRLALSADGRVLAACSDDNVVRVWDVATGLIKCSRANVSPWSLAFSPDGATLAYASTDNAINLWKWGGGQPGGLQSPDVVRALGHSGAVRGLAYHPEGSLLASCSWDGFLSF